MPNKYAQSAPKYPVRVQEILQTIHELHMMVEELPKRHHGPLVEALDRIQASQVVDWEAWDEPMSDSLEWSLAITDSFDWIRCSISDAGGPDYQSNESVVDEWAKALAARGADRP